ncbi:hypothetical protein K402DRAFT_391472 [Aulographum hederae CBS 113979]|uniref:Uncharacterized protein n=1 Tax=Aulographum hederae CBS 113979 TaxID=1176131 RepID=A0A6G1H6X0_9PEZI|nr:hypothetical protein K402DRAFT_391472 [Aulographum hederae CBS 113979]
MDISPPLTLSLSLLLTVTILRPSPPLHIPYLPLPIPMPLFTLLLSLLAWFFAVCAGHALFPRPLRRRRVGMDESDVEEEEEGEQRKVVRAVMRMYRHGGAAVLETERDLDERGKRKEMEQTCAGKMDGGRRKETARMTRREAYEEAVLDWGELF